MEVVGTLGPAACLRLLAGRSVGRVAYTERALPAVRPVHYALSGRHLVLHTGQDTLAGRLDGQVVAVQVDDVDAGGAFGWSVLVTGTATVVPAPAGPHEARGPWRGRATAVQVSISDLRGERYPGGSSVSGSALLERHRPAEPGPVLRGRPQAQGPAELLGPGAEVGEPAATPTFGETDAVVIDLQQQLPAAGRHEDVHGAGPGVTGGIAQGLP